MRKQRSNPDGSFKAVQKIWSLDNFDCGYINNGRLLVKQPNHPRAYKNGYMLRSVLAYEAYHGIRVPRDMKTHHKDGDKLNDTKENLAILTKSEHRLIHHNLRKHNEKRVCENCGSEFYISKCRLKDLSGGIKKRGRFCSQKCYHGFKRSEEHNKNISAGLKKSWKEGERHKNTNFGAKRFYREPP